ncbi:hypothetical protein ABPG72_018114 [Tetrahymena utriculariae]
MQVAKQITNKLQQFRYLKYLEVDISENPQLCYYGLTQFGDSIKLQMNLTTLELNMKNGFMNSYQVIEFLNQVKQCTSITTMTLNLRANFISEDVKDLASVISQFQNLKTLKLDQNGTSISPQSAEILGKELSNCQNLLHLNINLLQKLFF